MNWDRTLKCGDIVTLQIRPGVYKIIDIIERDVRGFNEYPPLIIANRVYGGVDDGFHCDISWAERLTPERLTKMMRHEQELLNDKYQTLAVLLSGA